MNKKWTSIEMNDEKAEELVAKFKAQGIYAAFLPEHDELCGESFIMLTLITKDEIIQAFDTIEPYYGAVLVRELGQDAFNLKNPKKYFRITWKHYYADERSPHQSSYCYYANYEIDGFLDLH